MKTSKFIELTFIVCTALGLLNIAIRPSVNRLEEFDLLDLALSASLPTAVASGTYSYAIRTVWYPGNTCQPGQYWADCATYAGSECSYYAGGCFYWP